MFNWLRELFESDEQRVGRWLNAHGADDSAANQLVFLHRYHCIDLSEMGIEVYCNARQGRVRWMFYSPIDKETISGEHVGGLA